MGIIILCISTQKCEHALYVPKSGKSGEMDRRTDRQMGVCPGLLKDVPRGVKHDRQPSLPTPRVPRPLGRGPRLAPARDSVVSCGRPPVDFPPWSQPPPHSPSPHPGAGCGSLHHHDPTPWPPGSPGPPRSCSSRVCRLSHLPCAPARAPSCPRTFARVIGDLVSAMHKPSEQAS